MSINLFLFDPLHPDETKRFWSELLPTGFEEVTLTKEGFQLQTGVVRDGLILAHARPLDRQLPEVVQNAIDTLETQRLFLVVVSGGSQESLGHYPRLYQREALVAVDEVDLEFRDCFDFFWADLLRNPDSPKFYLLEPTDRHVVPVLTTLCEGYLVSHAKPDGESWGPNCIREALGELGLLDVKALKEEEIPDELCARLHAQRAWFTDLAEWRNVLGNTAELKTQVAHELRVENLDQISNLSMFLDHLGDTTKGEVVPSILAAGYCEIRHVRSGTGGQSDECLDRPKKSV